MTKNVSEVAVAPPGQEGELSFHGLVMRLWERRNLAIGIFVTFVSVSVVYLFLATPWYERRVVIKIGQVGPTGSLESPENLVGRLKIKYLYQNKKFSYYGMFPGKGNLISVTNLGKNGPKSYVKLIVESDSAEKAKSFLASIMGDIFSRHKELFELLHEKSRHELKKLRKELSQVSKAIKKIQGNLNIAISGNLTQSMIAQQPTLQFLTQTMIAQQQILQLLQYKIELEEKVNKMELSLEENNTFETQILPSPDLPGIRVRPKKVQILLLGILLGIVGGVFGALVVDVLHGFRKKSA